MSKQRFAALVTSILCCSYVLLTPSSSHSGIDSPGWFDDVSAGRLPAILEIVAFGSLEADFGDLDNDGHADIVIANDGNEPLLILWNNGFGVFREFNLISVPGRVATDVDLGDVDGDGDLDIIVGMADFEGAQNRLLISNGDRTFTDETATRLPVAMFNTRDVDLVDVDGDGHLDIIEANVVILLTGEGRQNRILINDGRGFFTDETLTEEGLPYRFPIDNASTRSILAVDADGDGDLDLVSANRFDSPLWGQNYDGPQNKLWINDGNGFFTDETFRFPVDELSSRDVTGGDVDGDGDKDLVFGNAIGDPDAFSGGGQQNVIYINDGTGHFLDETLRPDGTGYRLPALSKLTKSVDLVDIDLDGDLDLIVANSRGENGFQAPQPGQQNRILINDGAGFFADETLRGVAKRLRLPFRLDNTYDIDLADVDGDGDLDIFAANREEPSVLLLNRTLREIFELFGQSE